MWTFRTTALDNKEIIQMLKCQVMKHPMHVIHSDSRLLYHELKHFHPWAIFVSLLFNNSISFKTIQGWWEMIDGCGAVGMMKIRMNIGRGSRSQWPRVVKAWTIFARSNAEIVSSNRTQGLDVYVRLFCVCLVLHVRRGFATGWSPVQEVISTVYRIKKPKSSQGPTKGCRTVIIIVKGNFNTRKKPVPMSFWRP
jgi:hypothetical protein